MSVYHTFNGLIGTTTSNYASRVMNPLTRGINDGDGNRVVDFTYDSSTGFVSFTVKPTRYNHYIFTNNTNSNSIKLGGGKESTNGIKPNPDIGHSGSLDCRKLEYDWVSY